MIVSPNLPVAANFKSCFVPHNREWSGEGVDRPPPLDDSPCVYRDVVHVSTVMVSP